MVDWTHAQFAPLTMDVIHLLFTSVGGNMVEYITEALNEYYDLLKVRLDNCVVSNTPTPGISHCTQSEWSNTRP